MPDLSDYSDHEDEHDIVAEYENRESDGEHGNVNEDRRSGSENEENEETTKRRIDPSKKHVVRNPLPKLNTERLKGPKGIQTIEQYFEGFKFHGKGHEKLDLDRVMKRMEHWAHRLFPKLEFDGFLERLENLGTKKDLQVYIKKYRQDMITADDGIIVNDNEEAEGNKEEDEPIDEFDLLISEQIEKQKQVAIQRSTSANNDDAFDKLISQSTNNSSQPTKEMATSSPSQLSDEVKERIERNRQQAIQRRLARLKAVQEEEAKRKKLEENKDTQLDNSSYDSQLSNDIQNLENKIPGATSQNISIESVP